MDQPRRPLLSRPRPPGTEDRLPFAHQFRLQEQVAEGGVSQVVFLRGQDHFRIASHLNGPWSIGPVRHGDSPQLNVVLGGDANLHVRIDLCLAAAEFGTALGENRFVPSRGLERRLPRCGPEGAALQVAQVAKRSPTIARAVFAPARNGQVAPAAVAAARAGHHEMVSAVGKQIDLRDRPTWVGKDPHRAPIFGRGGVRGAGFREVGEDRCGGLGHALLQQQTGGTQHRIGFKAALHRPVQEHVRQRQQAHALVVGHELPHRDARCPPRQP